MTTETSNGQATGHWETFRDKANRLRTVSSLDRLFRQAIAEVPNDATNVRVISCGGPASGLMAYFHKIDDWASIKP